MHAGLALSNNSELMYNVLNGERIMKNETATKDERSQNDGGFPIQAMLMLGVLVLAIFVLILKFIGVL